MIINRNIIIFGDDWGRYPSTIQHIGRVLAKHNRIIWVGSLGLRKPHLSWADLKRVLEKTINLIKKDEKSQTDRLPVYPVHPFIIPFHNIKIIRLFNSYSVYKKITKISKLLKFSDPLIITASPVVSDIIKKLNGTSAHYLCLDDFTQFKDAYKCIHELENELLENVDSCFAVSEDLVKTRKPVSGESYLISQGVDTEHFSPVVDQNLILKKNKKKIVGFFGLLADWIDLELIAEAARTYPRYEFIIIGKSEQNLSVFAGIDNLKYISEVPYTELPEYARSFDVGIIPFRINKLTIASNPLKLKEYLALGIPVVSTNLPEVERFGDLVFVAKNNEEFVSLIESAMSDNTESKNNMRRNIAERYSWNSITESMLELISQIEKK